MPKHPPVDPDHPYRSIPSSRQMLAGFVLALSNFMVVLDLTIANVSVPHISGDVGASLDQGTWIITSYAVAEAISVPLTGWLAQRFGAVAMTLEMPFKDHDDNPCAEFGWSPHRSMLLGSDCLAALAYWLETGGELA